MRIIILIGFVILLVFDFRPWGDHVNALIPLRFLCLSSLIDMQQRERTIYWEIARECKSTTTAHTFFFSPGASALNGQIFCASSRFSEVSHCSGNSSMCFRMHQFAGMMFIQTSDVTQTGVKFHVLFIYVFYIITIMFAVFSLCKHKHNTFTLFFCIYCTTACNNLHIYYVTIYIIYKYYRTAL